MEITRNQQEVKTEVTEGIEKVQVQTACLGDSERKGETVLCFSSVWGSFTEDCIVLSDI